MWWCSLRAFGAPPAACSSVKSAVRARVNVLRVRCRCTKEGSDTLASRTAGRSVSIAVHTQSCRTGIRALEISKGVRGLGGRVRALGDRSQQRLRCASWLSKTGTHALVLPSFVVLRVEAPTGTPQSTGHCRQRLSVTALDASRVPAERSSSLLSSLALGGGQAVRLLGVSMNEARIQSVGRYAPYSRATRASRRRRIA